MRELFDQVSGECAKITTQRYSTSFSLGIRLFDKALRQPIYNIYGFVRFADEIVDTFHDQDKARLLQQFELDTYAAIEQGISLNPILNAFQETVNAYNIPKPLIAAFLKSMAMDLEEVHYDDALYQTYIYGSAEVIGLMCLMIFCDGQLSEYERLRPHAQSLGSAFQKVNFLRDIKSDYEERGRTYFPEFDFNTFTQEDKEGIEQDIKKDFDHAYEGILELPKSVRLGVYVAYVYYTNLFKKIKSAPVAKVKQDRIRVPDSQKLLLLMSSTVRHRFNLL